MIYIRRLLPNESLLWKKLRILALLENPNVFFSYSSVEEERSLTNTEIQEQFEKQTILGAFNDEILIGIFGFRVFKGTKLSHRGAFFDMYVHSKYRGDGITSQLLEAMLEIARKKVIQVHVSLSSMDKKNVEFYRHYGFEWMAAHPCSLKIGEQFYDEEIMVLKLDS